VLARYFAGTWFTLETDVVAYQPEQTEATAGRSTVRYSLLGYQSVVM
jgi:hypothetical protein